MNTFGLDIGATSMKLVMLHKTKSSFVLKSCLMTVTPAKGMFSESPVDQQAMAQAVQRLVVDAKVTSKSVTIALPENQVFTKVIEMPELSDKELSSAIYWEAEQHIPAPLNTMAIDYKVVRRNISHALSPKMQVLLVGAPSALVHRYQQIIEMTGLSIAAVETEIISVVRALIPANSTATLLLVTIGALSTSLAIVQAGTIIFTYSIPLGGAAMDRAIASNFGFAPQQAEEYKKTYGINDQSLGGKISLALQPILMSILTEVKKALAYYVDKYANDTPISQIVLTGGSSLLPGLDLFFVKNAGIETIIGNPWKTFPVTGVTPELIDQGPRFSVAIGLAMRSDG
ncbi:MAG TPA: type IV pilus assembly protein PilM [Patescibacteria group bacterium]|nr:type IV pilus assembly protein PilM [Patescibacteria group bacterium]